MRTPKSSATFFRVSSLQIILADAEGEPSVMMLGREVGLVAGAEIEALIEVCGAGDAEIAAIAGAELTVAEVPLEAEHPDKPVSVKRIATLCNAVVCLVIDPP